MYDRWRSLVVVFGWLCSYVHWLYIFYRSVPQPVVLTWLNGRPTLMFGLVCSYCHTGDGMLIWSYRGWYAHIVIQGLVCSYGHTFYSHLLVSNICWYAHMLIYHTFISFVYSHLLAGILEILHSDCNTLWSMCHMYKHFGHCYTSIYGHCYTSIYGYSTQALWLLLHNLYGYSYTSIMVIAYSYCYTNFMVIVKHTISSTNIGWLIYWPLGVAVHISVGQICCRGSCWMVLVKSH